MAGGGVVAAGVSGVDITSNGLWLVEKKSNRSSQAKPRPDLEMQTVPMKSRVSQPDTETHNAVKERGKSLWSL